MAAFAEDPVGGLPEMVRQAFSEGDVIVESFEVDEEPSESRLGVQDLTVPGASRATLQRFRAEVAEDDRTFDFLRLVAEGQDGRWEVAGMM